MVLLGSRSMRLGEITGLAPGAIVELPKNAEDELELLVNNKVIATGRAVKVGENFGLRITFVGDVRHRVTALGNGTAAAAKSPEDSDAEALAEAMLAGQG